MNTQHEPTTPRPFDAPDYVTEKIVFDPSEFALNDFDTEIHTGISGAGPNLDEVLENTAVDKHVPPAIEPTEKSVLHHPETEAALPTIFDSASVRAFTVMGLFAALVIIIMLNQLETPESIVPSDPAVIQTPDVAPTLASESSSRHEPILQLSSLLSVANLDDVLALGAEPLAAPVTLIASIDVPELTDPSPPLPSTSSTLTLTESLPPIIRMDAVNDTPQPKTALELAREKLSQGDFAAALVDYQALEKSHPATAILGQVRAMMGLKDEKSAYALLLRFLGNPKNSANSEARNLYKKLSGGKAAILITTFPEGAEITVGDKKLLKSSPVILTELEAKDYLVKITKDGFNPYEVSSSLKPGEFTAIKIKLKENK